MPNLCAIATAAIDAFNNAQTQGNYGQLGSYLCHGHVIIHRVDDATPIQGSSADIVSLLNACQIGLWPQFHYTACAPGLDPNVVVVTGDYCDTAGGARVPVKCSYHFNSDLKIDSAFAVPL